MCSTASSEPGATHYQSLETCEPLGPSLQGRRPHTGHLSPWTEPAESVSEGLTGGLVLTGGLAPCFELQANSQREFPTALFCPRWSLMLTCNKFLEMLPFLFQGSLSIGESPNLNPVAEFPLVTPVGMFWHLFPCCLPPRRKVEFSEGQAPEVLGPWGLSALQSGSRMRGPALRKCGLFWQFPWSLSSSSVPL